MLMTSSHVLMGTISFNILSDDGICGLVFSAVLGVLLFILAIMPLFTEAAILGYIDLLSVMTAILVTVIASSVDAPNKPGGLSAADWSAWLDPNATFKDGIVAICNMLFAYCFAIYIILFISEIYIPTDFIKSVWTFSILKIFIYTLTGILIYTFISKDI
jgi:hypothetical protein